jgi:hypothetical protein
MTNPTQLIEQLVRALEKARSFEEGGTGLAMAALTAAHSHLEQPTEPAPVISYGMQSIHDAITDDPSLCEPSRPPNCGTGYCSCIECVMEPAPSMAGEVPKIGCVGHDCAECQARAALPVGELTGPSGDKLSDFSADQWWLPELDAAVANGTHDQKRAVAVVRNLLATIAAAPAQPVSGWKLVPIEATPEMKRAAVIYANGNAVYKNVATKALEIEEGIYGEVYESMIAAAPTGEPG